MSCPITPLDGWVVVRVLEVEEETTKGGIILANNLSAQEKEKRKNKGLVLAVPKVSPVSEGCIVCYKSYAGQDVYVKGEQEKYLLLEIQDIAGVVYED